MKKWRIIGMIIYLISIIFTVLWFDWKLVIILMIALWGNNLEQQNKEQYYGSK